MIFTKFKELAYERTNVFIKINSLNPIELSCFNYGLVASVVLFLVCQFVKTDSSNTYTMVKTEHSDYKSQLCDVLKLIEKFKFEHNLNEILCEIDNRVEFLEDYLDFGFVFLSLTLQKAYANRGFELTEITNIEQHIKHHRIIFDCGTTLMILK